MPFSTKNVENKPDDHMDHMQKVASYRHIVMDKIFKSVTPSNLQNKNDKDKQRFLIEPSHKLTKRIGILQSERAKSISEIEEYVFNIIHSRKNKDERFQIPAALE